MNIFSYILDVFILMITTYFFNQILLILLSFMRSNKQRRLWSGILLTVLDFALIWVYALNVFVIAIKSPSISSTASEIVFGCMRIAGVVFIYLFFMTAIFGKIRLKTRRQKEFERAMGNRNKNYLTPILIFSIALVAGIIGWIFYHINYISDYSTDLWISRVITIVSAIGLAYFATKAIVEKKKPVQNMNFSSNFNSGFTRPNNPQSDTFTVPKENFKERTCVFIIQENDDCHFYKGTYRGKVALNELVGNIGDYYYISSYGILKAKGEEYDLFGVKTSYFDDNLFNQIKLAPFSSKEVEAIIPYLEKNHAKVFELDENNNPINSFDA